MLCLHVVAFRMISTLPEHHIHYVLRQTWILKPGPNDTDHKPQSTMYGFVIPSLYIYWLATYTTFMLFYVAAIFWYELLLEETIQQSCNPSGVECFFYTNFWDSFKFVEPIDCNHVPRGVYTFACYKYKFDINGAFETAGCAFGISTFIIKALPACFLFLKRCDAQMHRKLRYPIVLLCLIISLVVFILPVHQKLWKISPTYIFELWSISLGILLSLTILLLDFKIHVVPASKHQ